jgi:hypothetical protein
LYQFCKMGAAMTTYLDYKTIPSENNSPPPVGAPEGMPTSQVNNIAREMMSVIRQLGDQTQADIAALGTMSQQNADAVAITGGTITATFTGAGGGLTNLKAQNLIEGPIPAAIFPGDGAPLNVKVARAGNADTLGGLTWTQLMPIGAIIMWWSNNPVPAGWHVCDGTAGTPNLVGRYLLAAGPGVALGQTGGAWNASAATDAQGQHSHAGVTTDTALSVAQMPSHAHQEVTGAGAGGGGYHIISQMSVAQSLAGLSVNTNPAGSGAAHNHGIYADGNHAHNVTVATASPYTAVFFIMRIS